MFRVWKLRLIKIYFETFSYLCTCMYFWDFLFFFFSENVHTGVNFVDKIESCAMVRFIRLTFVRPKDKNNIEGRGYSPPSSLSYKTFIPCAVKVGMCTGAPEYENFSASWDRARVWLKIVGEYTSLLPPKYFLFL